LGQYGDLIVSALKSYGTNLKNIWLYFIRLSDASYSTGFDTGIIFLMVTEQVSDDIAL